MNQIIVEGITIATDEEGFLVNKDDWNESVCEFIAQQDRCELRPEHWQVIHFLREFHQDFDHSPAMRVLIKALKSVFDEDKANSAFLYELFPYGPAKQASKYAGLPKPAHCI